MTQSCVPFVFETSHPSTFKLFYKQIRVSRSITQQHLWRLHNRFLKQVTQMKSILTYMLPFSASWRMTRHVSTTGIPRLVSNLFKDVSTPCCDLDPHRGYRKLQRWTTRSIQLELQAHLLIADTMFELVKALNDGAEVLKCRTPNLISPNAGCQLFITFVTLFPHNSVVRFKSNSTGRPSNQVVRISWILRENSFGKANNMLRRLWPIAKR